MRNSIILQVNATYEIGSTGKIVKDLDGVMKENKMADYIICAYANKKVPSNVNVSSSLNNWLAVRINLLQSRITGRMGYNHRKRTQELINMIERVNPGLVHLHNIHGNWINIFEMFNYLKERNKKVIWTLHDCWAITGRCSHFELCGCDKWKTGCYNCKNKKVYPSTYFFDHSKKMWIDKKNLFSSIPQMTIVTPSNWLADYVRESYFKDCEILTINNGIDLRSFYPRETESKYLKDIKGKKIILGVASSWSDTKGFNDFIQIDRLLDHNKYHIVLVGLNNRQMKEIPKSIYGIRRTENQEELAELYSNASVFVNPTYQDNYPTTNLEALACGTPAISYRTGGSPESIYKKEWIIEQGDMKSLYSCLLHVINNKPDRTKLREHAIAHFDKDKIYKQYIDLYKSKL